MLRFIAASALLLAAAPAAASPGSDAARAYLAEMEALHAAHERRVEVHPADTRALIRALEAYAAKFRAAGLEAVPILGFYAGDEARPLRLRVFAAAFLGFIGDPSALPALTRTVFDESADHGLRAAALQSAGSLRLEPKDLRPLLERAADPANPEPLVREALSQLAWTGSDRAGLMTRLAKRHGRDPRGLERGSAAHAVAALGRSNADEAVASLFDLLGYFRMGSPLRPRVLAALSRLMLVGPRAGRPRRAERPRRRDLRALGRLLHDEDAAAAASAARLLGAFRDPRGVAALARAVRNASSPAVVAEAAEALAAIGDRRAEKALSGLRAGLIRDPRFRPRPGAPDPREFAVRVESAASVFDAAPPAAPAAPAGPADPDAAHRSEPFAYEGWPGEGRPNPVWNGTVANLLLRSAPRGGAARTGAARLAGGERVPIIGSLVRTVKPGVALALRDVELEAFEVPEGSPVPRRAYEGAAVRRAVRVPAGRTVELLAYLAGGRCFIRYSGEAFLADCPQNDRARFEVVEEADTEWWIETRVLEKSGWFRAEQEGIEFGERSF